MSTTDQLRAAMRAIEDASAETADTILSEYEKLYGQNPDLAVAALFGLGSKYLAVGAPETCGIIGCGSAGPAIIACHTLLFGPLEYRVVGESIAGTTSTSVEDAFACDLVCLATDQDFSLHWIADATHLNVRQADEISAAVKALCEIVTLTALKPRQETEERSLSEVICGQVSGRVGEELTMLRVCS
ncbi:MAG: hypothetical protein JKY56_13610 [Kofleriaceae bacterium]|nr:hypothetical protein [Kofleriaceae bacterium]